MSTATAQRLILLSAVTVGAVETYRQTQKSGGLNIRLFLGGGIVYTVLAGGSEILPGAAAGFALLIMTGVLLTDGSTVAEGILNGPKTAQTITTKYKSHNPKLTSTQNSLLNGTLPSGAPIRTR